MFRKPREAKSTDSHVIPSAVGRPPSPPSSTKPMAATRTISSRSSGGAKQAQMPTIGRGSTNPKKSATNNNQKPKGKPNGSILSFFKKDDGLFVAGTGAASPEKEAPSLDIDVDPISVESDEGSRYNEDEGAIKRRKLDSPAREEEQVKRSESPKDTRPLLAKVPFVEESSDSEDEDAALQVPIKASEPPPIKKEDNLPEQLKISAAAPPKPPPLIHQPTSTSVMNDDGFVDFEGADDFEDDVFDQGEENLERVWMEEQGRLEWGDDDDVEIKTEQDDTHIKTEEPAPSTESPPCPICNIGLQGVSESDAAVHVNNCLDGNPTPLPTPVKIESPATTAPSPTRFKKPERAPKPGQSQPSAASASGSAFSKLMSSRAEDVAWANAAAAENASRGKPSYTRTCPFYKIMPGLDICVDAFRYGAVAGCNAYFLSHFHSDHYVGLTSTWTHGPIYCSKVTANLVRQQLRVDPQYILPLEWETKTAVPGTPDVTVTMISANHCPGSSLFLFEKPTSKGPSPKLQRILHCGDFRACRAHVRHPLLRPDVLDTVTGKSREQKLDICYLDTTYLNPKYAFPSQEEVITACAEMCVSLNKVSPDSSDGWEKMKRSRAGKGMVDFIRKDNPAPPTPAEENKDLKLHANGKLSSDKSRGRLLVVVGTYSIGKERICIGVAKALGSKIYAPPAKQRICRALEDAELEALLTKDPREAQVHMTPLFEIRADTLDEYLQSYADAFARCVGFRPSGWNYRPPTSRVESPTVNTILHSSNWKSSYGMKDLVPQRGSTKRAACFGVPYSEHSSFRELTMFCCGLRIGKVIPTVNVGSVKGREGMKGWIERWEQERKKNGVFDGEGW